MYVTLALLESIMVRSCIFPRECSAQNHSERCDRERGVRNYCLSVNGIEHIEHAHEKDSMIIIDDLLSSASTLGSTVLYVQCNIKLCGVLSTRTL